jgi:hypothetical protein
LDALEFAGAVEGGDPLAEVVEGQRSVSWERMIIPSWRAGQWQVHRACQNQGPSLRSG